MATTNPYAAPKAAVADETVVLNADFVPGGQARPTANGWTWITEGWEIFKRQPGMWIGIILLAFIIFIAGSVLPVVGPFVMTLFGPVFAAGFMAGCKTLDTGGELELGHLFAGFRSRTGVLLAIGAVYVAAYVAILLLVAVSTGVPVSAMLGEGDPQVMLELGMKLVLAWLIVLALLLPVIMAIWLAPALILFHAHGVGEAMKGSFTGCLKNILPFLLYSVILFAFSVVATLPLLLGWLVLGPVFAASVYASYRDIYLRPRQ